MAASLRCTECDAMLRLASAPAVGQKVKCPKCGSTFLPTSIQTEPERAPISSSQSPKSEPPKAAAPPPAPKAAPKPTPMSLDEDKPAPARKLAPKAQQSDDDDDEDDRPRKSAAKNQRSDDDDDDDRPRKQSPKNQRSDDDDDDYDDRQRRTRKKRKQQIQGNGLVIGLCVGGGIFAILCIGGLVFWLTSGQKADSGKDMFAAAPPADTTPPPADSSKRPPDNNNQISNLQSSNKPAPTQKGNDLPQDILEKTRRATAFIEVDIGPHSFTGSGFVVKSNGETAYVITNNHVISLPDESKGNTRQLRPPTRLRPPGVPPPPMFNLPGGRPPSIFNPPGLLHPNFPNNSGPNKPQEPKVDLTPKVRVILNRSTPEEQTLTAKIVAFDDEADLAALRIVGARNLPTPIDLAEDASMSETQPVFIFGFPGGQRNITIGRGSISQLRRDENNELTDVQINGQINPGNSGGPVVDSQGRLIGVAVGYVPGANLGFAVPTAQLNHMLRGGIRSGLVSQLRQQGSVVEIGAELWRFDRQNRVRKHVALDVPLGESANKLNFPTNEFQVCAMLNDPMQKLSSVTLHYGLAPPNPIKQDAHTWAPLPNATQLPLKFEDLNSVGEIKLPPGAQLNQMYAFQFSYVTVDNQTVYMEPHFARLTFPKN